MIIRSQRCWSQVLDTKCIGDNNGGPWESQADIAQKVEGYYKITVTNISTLSPTLSHHWLTNITFTDSWPHENQNWNPAKSHSPYFQLFLAISYLSAILMAVFRPESNRLAVLLWWTSVRYFLVLSQKLEIWLILKYVKTLKKVDSQFDIRCNKWNAHKYFLNLFRKGYSLSYENIRTGN